MSGMVLRIIIAFIFAFHGVGHAMGIIPALGLVNEGGLRQGRGTDPGGRLLRVALVNQT